jgi:glycosyltransferase involved in cell wall biosynthesis
LIPQIVKKVDPPPSLSEKVRPRLKLIIVHYHLRPGGIRRIIELAVPHLLREVHPVAQIVLATGESPDRTWERLFRSRAGETPVEFFVESTFRYFSEQRRSVPLLRKRLREALHRLLKAATGNNTLVWAHNLGIGRNLLLTQALVEACVARSVPLVAHHHDWWFDNRWLRWREMRRSGFRTLASVARVVFSSALQSHLTINRADATVLRRHLGRRVGWLPNLIDRGQLPWPARVGPARAWLRRKLNDSDAPIWILPCRLLRRKNVAEALLLTRWLRPEAWLVTTGGISSADEKQYAEALGAAGHQHHWRLRLGVLTGDEGRKPTIPELLAVSECVLLTSIQEGFGLPYLEAAAAERPLIARALLNIAPDLERFGFRFPQYYQEVLVSPDLFDWKAERRRQGRLFGAWRAQLPRPVRKLVGAPVLLATDSMPASVPFSRLTLTAQLEVLARPVAESWDQCLPLNPHLAVWKQRAAAGRLRKTAWPAAADAWLSGHAYARRFMAYLKRDFKKPAPDANSLAAQSEFIERKLAKDQLFPLSWCKET